MFTLVLSAMGKLHDFNRSKYVILGMDDKYSFTTFQMLSFYHDNKKGVFPLAVADSIVEFSLLPS